MHDCAPLISFEQLIDDIMTLLKAPLEGGSHSKLHKLTIFTSFLQILNSIIESAMQVRIFWGGNFTIMRLLEAIDWITGIFLRCADIDMRIRVGQNWLKSRADLYRRNGGIFGVGH